jgi:small subunit ribosomal protein S17
MADEEETEIEPAAADAAAEQPQDAAQTPAAEAAVEAAPATAEPVAEVEAAPLAEEPAAESEAAPAAEEPAAEDEDAAEADGEPPAVVAGAPAHRPEPVAVIAPKQRRRLKRAAKAPAARGPLSAEDRQTERDALRASNAKARRGERLKARAEKPASETAAPAAVERAIGRPRARQGIVVSDKAAKTITVRVDTSRRHRRYKKIVRSSKTLHAHDEHNEAHEGDLVRVVETRPLSATKRWRLLEVLERAK